MQNLLCADRGFFALGLLAKSMVATLPFVLLLLDYWPLGRMRGIQNSEFRIQNVRTCREQDLSACRSGDW